MKNLLQPASEGEHCLYARLRDWSDPHSAERREYFRALWEQYEPFAPRGFAKKLQIEFHQRWWEMYLTVGMLHLGFKPKPSKSDQGPDLSLYVNGGIVFVEATAPSTGTKSDRVPEIIHNGVSDFPERECLLRLAQALTDKCRRFHEYIKDRVVPADGGFIIALSATNLNQFGTLLDAAHPAPLSVLAGAGPTVVTIGGKQPPYSSRRDTLKRDSGSGVDVCLFEKPEFRIIAGVLYSPVDLWNATLKPEDSISLFLNPTPNHPLAPSFRSRFVHWSQERLSSHELVWKKTQLT